MHRKGTTEGQRPCCRLFDFSLFLLINFFISRQDASAASNLAGDSYPVVPSSHKPPLNILALLRGASAGASAFATNPAPVAALITNAPTVPPKAIITPAPLPFPSTPDSNATGSNKRKFVVPGIDEDNDDRFEPINIDAFKRHITSKTTTTATTTTTTIDTTTTTKSAPVLPRLGAPIIIPCTDDGDLMSISDDVLSGAVKPVFLPSPQPRTTSAPVPLPSGNAEFLEISRRVAASVGTSSQQYPQQGGYNGGNSNYNNRSNYNRQQQTQLPIDDATVVTQPGDPPYGAPNAGPLLQTPLGCVRTFNDVMCGHNIPAKPGVTRNKESKYFGRVYYTCGLGERNCHWTLHDNEVRDRQNIEKQNRAVGSAGGKSADTMTPDELRAAKWTLNSIIPSVKPYVSRVQMMHDTVFEEGLADTPGAVVPPDRSMPGPFHPFLQTKHAAIAAFRALAEQKDYNVVIPSKYETCFNHVDVILRQGRYSEKEYFVHVLPAAPINPWMGNYLPERPLDSKVAEQTNVVTLAQRRPPQQGPQYERFWVPINGVGDRGPIFDAKSRVTLVAQQCGEQAFAMLDRKALWKFVDDRVNWDTVAWSPPDPKHEEAAYIDPPSFRRIRDPFAIMPDAPLPPSSVARDGVDFAQSSSSTITKTTTSTTTTTTSHPQCARPNPYPSEDERSASVMLHPHSTAEFALVPATALLDRSLRLELPGHEIVCVGTWSSVTPITATTETTQAPRANNTAKPVSTTTEVSTTGITAKTSTDTTEAPTAEYANATLIALADTSSPASLEYPSNNVKKGNNRR